MGCDFYFVFFFFPAVVQLMLLVESSLEETQPEVQDVQLHHELREKAWVKDRESNSLLELTRWKLLYMYFPRHIDF